MRASVMLVTAAVIAATALAAGPALADPPATPRPSDTVGVGEDTTQNLMDQFSSDYNASHPTGPRLYSFDATNPTSGAIGDPITTKKGCGALPRPDGAQGGITELEVNNGTTSGHPCIDFAQSARPRTSTDPGTITFVKLAMDAVTWATEPNTNAPSNLTTGQLSAIYDCKITNWDQLPGGKNGKPKIFIPQVNSGLRAFFQGAIGLPFPGSCVSDLATTAQAGGTLQDNEGVNPVFKKSPQDVIFIYSVGKYIAEKYHSAKCLNEACTPVKGITCKPVKGQNQFGCDTHGTLVLHSINGTNPTVTVHGNVSINPNFTPTFSGVLFDVLRAPEGSIPSYLQPLFGPKGYVCTSPTARAAVQHYGFLVLPTGTSPADCGFAS